MPSRYEAPVDPDAPNNSHAFVLSMIGWNKSVLELGAASGHMTRALQGRDCRVTALEFDPEAAQDLKEIAADVVIADLNSHEWINSVTPRYDVILAGDVLEHLIDPQTVLNQMKTLLGPQGFIVISLPHVAHADVRLSLLQGRFDYNDWGLLDQTHIRFFTLKTIKELVERAGFVISDMRRVRIPAFESELHVDRASVSTAVLNGILADPEAETYQFVFTIIPDDGDRRRRTMAEQRTQLESTVAGLRVKLVTADIERVELASRLAQADAARVGVQEAIARLLATKTFRYTARARRVYQRIRRMP